jgi:hypothetical protein
MESGYEDVLKIWRNRMDICSFAVAEAFVCHSTHIKVFDTYIIVLIGYLS